MWVLGWTRHSHKFHLMALFSTRMTIFDSIKRDHHEVKDLMEEIVESESSEERSHLFAEMKEKLDAHAEAEEAVLYSRLRDESPTHDLVLEAGEEHRLVKQLLGELEKADIDDAWMAKFHVMKESVEHHVREEENVLLPRAKQIFTKEEARDMADEFMDAKEDLIPVAA